MQTGFRQEIIETRLMERSVTGSGAETNFFRPPGGAGVGDPNVPNASHSDDALYWQTIGECGYYNIAWHKYPGDNITLYPQTVSDDGSGGTSGSQKQANSIINTLENNISDGDIILMHNGRFHTVLALQTLLQYWSINGWKFVTVTRISPL